VDCDFQEVPAGMPKRSRQRTPDRGFYFVQEAREPIEGPKTQEEAEEEIRLAQGMIKYMAFREKHWVEIKPNTKENPVWKTWTPRWENMEIGQWERTPVRVYIEELGEFYDWVLRRDLEWQDFRFLVNSKLGHNNWDAILGGNPWRGDVVFNGRIIKPFPNQEVRVTFSDEYKIRKKKEKILARKQEAWDRISMKFQDYDDWHLDEVPTEEGLTEPVSNDEDYSIAVEFPGDEEIRLMRIPRGNEWAFFETFVSTKLGADKWIAGFYDGLQEVPWDTADRVPRPGQRVRIFWIKEETKWDKKGMKEEKLREITQVIFSRPKTADAHPVMAGGRSHCH
jgi:hypothetical protein